MATRKQVPGPRCSRLSQLPCPCRMFVVLLEGRCRFTVNKVVSEEPYFVVRKKS